MPRRRLTPDHRIRITRRRGVYRLYRLKDGTRHPIYYPAEYATTDRSVAEQWARELEIKEATEHEAAKHRKADPYADHRETPLYQLDPDGKLIGGHLHTFVETIRTAGRTAKHVTDTRDRCLRILQEANIERWEQIDAAVVQVAIANLRYRPKRKRKIWHDKPAEQLPLLLNQTRRYYLRAIKHFTSWMALENRAPRDPLYGLRPNKLWKGSTPKHPRGTLTVKQFSKLIASTMASAAVVEDYDGQTRALLYLLAANLGFRRRELSSLSARNFYGLDGDQPLASLDADWSKRRKNDALRMDPRLARLVRARFAALPDGSKLFPGLITPENEKDCAKMIKRDLADAGLPYQTEQGEYHDFHSLRHYFCTGCVRSATKAGIPLKAVLKLTRHSSVELLSRYTHTDEAETEAIRRGLPKLPLPVEGVA